ncbi:hypothetical protein JTB14_008723 [Gonioctena quinquepunctata]|nr:hypothetical protein JTB14_008723 [Gonioctena quinquepunctata]
MQPEDTEPVQLVEPEPVATTIVDENEFLPSEGTSSNADLPEPMDTDSPPQISEPTDQDQSDLAISAAATEELLETLSSEAPASSEIFTSEAAVTSEISAPPTVTCAPIDAVSVEATSGDNVSPEKDSTEATVENQDEVLVEEEHNAAPAAAAVDPGDPPAKPTVDPVPVYSLEEELQRLHEGDPIVEESFDEKQVQESEKTKESAVEEQKSEVESSKLVEKSKTPVQKSTEFREKLTYSVGKSSKTIEKTVKPKATRVTTPLIKIVQTPIMKDSELEEMLAADEILSDPVLIRESLEDMKVTDVLVCGKCHESFSFLEEFQKHKSKKCQTKSSLLSFCENENRPQIWAFTLWKNKHIKHRKLGPIPNSWNLYQKWVQLPKTDKDAWMSAGDTLQFCSKIASAKLTEVKQNAKVDNDLKQNAKTPQVKKIEQVGVKKEEQDPLALDASVESNKENSSVGNLKKPIIEIKKPVISKPPMKLVKEVILPNPKNELESNKAMRTTKSVEKGEYAVERIVAKRYNAKKKSWEYQIKWEHFPSEDNTWEPMENLNHCKLMVDEFEKQLSKLKAEKAQQQAANLVKSRPKILNTSSLMSTPVSSSSSIGGETPNRPTRSSKQKALNQVKAWCGNISDDEKASSGVKRARTPDSDDSFEKRMKFEEFSDDSESESKPTPPKPQFRKIAPKPAPVQIINNGIGKATTLPAGLPPNILIPDANGVVRINQKQLPSLSTGVYIMSKTAGIIKLDSTTSKVATSGGQTIVKVAPKIGQAAIKIVKKDGSLTKKVVMTPTKHIPVTSPRVMKSVISKAKKPIEVKTPIMPKSPEITKTPDLAKKIQESSKKTGPVLSDKKPAVAFKKLSDHTPKSVVSKIVRGKEERKPAQLIYPESPKKEENDESDDGLEELPFPDEIKIPEPESPPSEFTLDPFTGKIAGVEYPDIPEPEPIEESKSDLSLDNIVKLAAADITEEDLKNEPVDTPMETEDQGNFEEEEDEEEIEEKVKLPVKTEPIRKIVSAPPARTVVRMSVMPKRSPSSILNKVLTGQQVVRKSILNTPTTPKVHQRILNPAMVRSPQVMNPIIKPINTAKLIRSHHEVSPKNVYTFSRSTQNMTRKIGNTTIRSATSPVIRTQPRIVQSNMNVVQRMVSPRKESVFIRGQPERVERKVAPAKPKTVISMPSLIGDDDLVIPPPKVVQPPKPKSPTPPPVIMEVNEPTPVADEGNEMENTLLSISKQELEEEPAAAAAESAPEASTDNLGADMSTFTLADNENPIFITGDDGTVYQVAGQNEQGQTILLTQGSDGQQQCLLVTNEVAEAMDATMTEEVTPQPEAADVTMPDISTDVTEPLSIKTDPTEGNDQVVAQVVRAEPPSPGGTHKVVVMLPDGNLMVTQVSPEEYASLELE